jgi:signal transduction histidine kinase
MSEILRILVADDEPGMRLGVARALRDFTVSLPDVGGNVVISVADTGIGLAEEDAARIFDDFVRIKNDQTRHILGSGLGLAIVRKLAALSGGDASVKGRPGAGSTFTVVLKQAAGEGAAPPPAGGGTAL